jgi:glutamate--cysteine ligase
VTLTRQDPSLDRVLEDREQLLDYFRAGEKPHEQFRVGTEHEKVGLYEATLEPVPYEGPRGIGALLAALHREHDFRAFLEGESIVGLEQNGATITLEPGGQLELSGLPFFSLHETCAEFHAHLDLVKDVSQRFGIAWLGLGIHPFASVEQIPRMPRERHEIMRSHLGRCGKLALDMMHATASVQASYDFSSAADVARKLRVALAASPVVTALYANSSFTLGRPNGFESWRAWIWRHTDDTRCGIPSFVFEESFEADPYGAYTDWALDIPMFFLVRDGRHVPVGGRSFRQMFEHGDTPLTLADWSTHLTTLFPEVRLKRVIEVRGADGVPADLVCSVPALWKGLLYDSAALDSTFELVSRWSHAEVDKLLVEVARLGLAARTPSGPAAEVARELVRIASEGLARIAVRNAAGEDERVLLAPLHALLDRGASPGRILLERWDGPLDHQPERLLEYARY